MIIKEYFFLATYMYFHLLFQMEFGKYEMVIRK
jgi:hypothetical protein